ncbi:MAG: hypothetical protein KUG81_07490, partial [Gammaproteobacteria bacterium]|nr:hypothetical protein [Gammaproteobacteria bacterium]
SQEDKALDAEMDKFVTAYNADKAAHNAYMTVRYDYEALIKDVKDTNASAEKSEIKKSKSKMEKSKSKMEKVEVKKKSEMEKSVREITRLVQDGANPSPYENLFDSLVTIQDRLQAQDAEEAARKEAEKATKKAKSSSKKKNLAAKEKTTAAQETSDGLTYLLETYHGYVSRGTADATMTRLFEEGITLGAEKREESETKFVSDYGRRVAKETVPSAVRKKAIELAEVFASKDQETNGLAAQWEREIRATHDAVMQQSYGRIADRTFLSFNDQNPNFLLATTASKVAVVGMENKEAFDRMLKGKKPEVLEKIGIEVSEDDKEGKEKFVAKLAETNRSLLMTISDVKQSMRLGADPIILRNAASYIALDKNYFTYLQAQVEHQVKASEFLIAGIKEVKTAKDVAQWFEENQGELDRHEEKILNDLHTNYTHHQKHPIERFRDDAKGAIAPVELRQAALAEQQAKRKTQENTETPPPPSIDPDTVSGGAQQESQALKRKSIEQGIEDGLRSNLGWEVHSQPILVKVSDGGLRIRTRKGDDAQAMQAKLTALGVTTSSVETDTASGMVTLTLNTEQARTLETKTRPTGIGLGLGDPHIRFEDDSVNGGTETRTPTTGSQTPLLPEEMAADLLVDPATSRASQQQLSETSNADADIFANLLDILSEEAGIPSQQDKEAGDTPQQGSNPLNFSELGNSLSKLPTEQTRTGNSGNPPPHATPPSAPPLPSDSSTGSPPPPHVTSRGTDSPPPHVTSRGAGSPPPPGNIDPLAALKREQAELEKELKRLKEDQAKRNADLSALQKEEKGLLAKEDRHREQGKLPIGGNLLGAGVVGIAFLINPIFGLFVLAAALLAVDAKPLYHKTKQADARSSRKSIQRTINNAESERNGHQPEIDDLAEKKTNVLEKITRIEKQQEAEQA